MGSGNIGTDLMVKILRSPHLECSAFIGRNLSSPGMRRAQSLGVRVSADSIGFLQSEPKSCDLVFDATSSRDHEKHAPILRELGLIAIDLTPAKLGPMCIPAVNMQQLIGQPNVNMVTCGGQASIPMAYVLGQVHPEIEYVEVVSSIASRSAGPATRQNLDEYIHTTETGILEFSGAKRAKAILNLNPAQPCINMQTTIMALVREPNLEKLKPAVDAMIQKIQTYVPGYELLVGPTLENNRIVIMVRVKGLGDYLPEYAGNLDIINCAAIAMAEQFARSRSSSTVSTSDRTQGGSTHEARSHQ